MKIKFYFVSPKKEKSSMTVSIAWNGNRIQYNIGLSHKTSAFDVDKQQFKKNTARASQLNNFLKGLENAISDFYYNSLATNKIVSKVEMKDFLAETLLKKEEIESSIEVRKFTAKEILDHFINFVEDNPLYTTMTKKKYKTFHNNFNRFIKTHYDIYINELDTDYLLNYALFLAKKLNYADATIHKALKIFTRILNKAFEDGLIDTQFYKPLFTKLYRELKLKQDSNKFALTKEEILKIEQYEPEEKDLKLTRDLFLFEIYTAQRVSDLFKTHKASVNLDDRTLNFRQTKTNEMVSIPLIDKAIDILKKYPNMEFPKISEQYYNRQIKELARNAGIDDLITIERKSLNRTEKIVKEKWELLASHHARVTCIVNMAQNGALPEEIITVTGHSNPRSIDPYMKIAEDVKKKRSRSALERAFG